MYIDVCEEIPASSFCFRFSTFYHSGVYNSEILTDSREKAVFQLYSIILNFTSFVNKENIIFNKCPERIIKQVIC